MCALRLQLAAAAAQPAETLQQCSPAFACLQAAAVIQSDPAMARYGHQGQAAFSAQVAAQMASPNFFASPNVTNAAAAAAASAVHSLMAGACQRFACLCCIMISSILPHI